jgi:ribosomal protein S27AE
MDAVLECEIQKTDYRVEGNIELIRLSLICPVCGHKWGIRIQNIKILERELTEKMRGDKWICNRCRYNGILA